MDIIFQPNGPMEISKEENVDLSIDLSNDKDIKKRVYVTVRLLPLQKNNDSSCIAERSVKMKDPSSPQHNKCCFLKEGVPCLPKVGKAILLQQKDKKWKKYHFDAVFNENASQLEIFSYLKKSVKLVTQGINVTIFAYGQSGMLNKIKNFS